jgi:hypothetical protein
VQFWLLGYDAWEIARDTDRSERTVFRTLELVKKSLPRLCSEEPEMPTHAVEKPRCSTPVVAVRRPGHNRSQIPPRDVTADRFWERNNRVWGRKWDRSRSLSLESTPDPLSSAFLFF